MFIDPIKGYYLEKTIKYTIFFQVLTTIYIFVKTIITKHSSIIYHNVSMNIYLYLIVIVLQCIFSLYLLNSQGKNPKHWKAWVLLLSTICLGSYNIKKYSQSVEIDLIGILLIISYICVIFTTYTYLKKFKKEKDTF
ncbi:hypothetical protein IGI58_001542 [Enterococcus sp. AZ020]